MKKLNSLILIAIISLFILSCAKIGSPPGGEKDETPPKAEKSNPANYSTNYNQKKIVITFDEFILLENAFTEFTVSPPLEDKPLPLVRGKKIIIDFPASELDSLTYTLDFGQAIKDNNEGNKLPNFQFVVSKLPYVDSFSVSGIILDAFTKKPDEEQIFVQLTNNLSDTAFQKEIPTYIGRTNPAGEFAINHLAAGTYNIFALKDANNNMLYDLPTEIIAFSNEPLILHPDSFAKPQEIFDSIIVVKDTVENDTALYISDSISEPDSLLLASAPIINDTLADTTRKDSLELMVYGISLNLYTFVEEEPFKQFLDDYHRKEEEKLSLFFSEEMDSPPTVRLLKPDTIGTWHYLENNPTNDTLVYWLADSNLVSKDSIVVEIIHPMTDSTGNLISVTDTLYFRSKAKKKKKTTKNSSKKGGLLAKVGLKNDTEKSDTVIIPVYRMKISSNIKSSAHDLNVPIYINSEAPITSTNSDLIEFFRIKDDTVEIPEKFTFLPDTNNKRRFKINVNYEAATSYRLKLHEGAFTDIYKRTIDSTKINFTTQKDDYYGIVYLNMTNIAEPTIVQLLSEKEEVLKSIKITESQKITFNYLHPGKYLLKVIYDENNNGKWDSGKYDEFLQPEHVEYFPQVVNVKSNWEVDFTWELKETISITRPVDEEKIKEEEEKKKAEALSR